MIINDKHCFAFIHIPKCAGTTVRSPLEQFDSYEGTFTNRVDEHQALGQLDYQHIPLYTLRDFFKPEFEKVCDYWSFVVMRDPYTRFASSVSQHLKMYGTQLIHRLGTPEIKAHIEQTIEFLLKQPRRNHQLPAEYAHFQKQVDYIYLDEKQVVNSIFTVSEVDDLLRQVSAKVGHDLISEIHTEGAAHANRSMVYRSEGIRRLLDSSRPIIGLVSRFMAESVRNKLRSALYVPRDLRFESLFASDYVRNFITDYYYDDIQLWNDITQLRVGAKEYHA